MAIGYVLVVSLLFNHLGSSCHDLRDALQGEAVAGGAIGAVIRYGVARGVFSQMKGLDGSRSP